MKTVYVLKTHSRLVRTVHKVRAADAIAALGAVRAQPGDTLQVMQPAQVRAYKKARRHG